MTYIYLTLYFFVIIEFIDAWFDAMIKSIAKEKNIAKDTQKPPRAGIAFAAVVVGGPFVYLGLMLIVLYRPEVMAWLGLEPFVAYLIEHQPVGYENLVQQNSPAFADYFFHFHAASLLAVGIINSLFVISMLACLNILPKIDRDFLNFLNSVSDINIKYFRTIFFIVALVLIFGGWFLISMPAQMELNTRFSPNNRGIGYSIFMWAVFSFFFQGVAMVIGLDCLHYYWPKLRSWLVNKRKPNQQIKHRAKQHHKEY